MCGIVGVLGNHEAAPLLVEALKRLEYRGYDSAGIATVNNGALDRRRAVGKLVNLGDLLVHEPLRGKAGIGHTRWATHGAPSVTNAHPHQAGPVAVVHNGIIENFRELRSELAGHGLNFVTQTDTETVALLTQHYVAQGATPVEAARQTIARLHGAFALVFLFEGEDDLLIAARKGSPLAIGHGEGEMFVGSDAIALAPMTDRITYLEEGDIAVLTRTSLEIRDARGELANRPVKTIQIEAAQVDKGGHKHFMAKEIAEQPRVISEALRFYLSGEGDTIRLYYGGCDGLHAGPINEWKAGIGLATLRKDGFIRVRIDGDIHTLEDKIDIDKNKKHTIDVVVDRLVHRVSHLDESLGVLVSNQGCPLVEALGICPRHRRRTPPVEVLAVRRRCLGVEHVVDGDQTGENKQDQKVSATNQPASFLLTREVLPSRNPFQQNQPAPNENKKESQRKENLIGQTVEKNDAFLPHVPCLSAKPPILLAANALKYRRIFRQSLLQNGIAAINIGP